MAENKFQTLEFRHIRKIMKFFSPLLILLLTVGILQSAYAIVDVTLTPPVMVSSTGKNLTSLHVGQQIGVESTLTNHGTSEQKFTYLVQVLDNTGRTKYLEGFSASMLPSQSFNASQVWIPKSTGTYTVQVFVWNSLASAIPLTNVIQTQISVGE